MPIDFKPIDFTPDASPAAGAIDFVPIDFQAEKPVENGFLDRTAANLKESYSALKRPVELDVIGGKIPSTRNMVSRGLEIVAPLGEIVADSAIEGVKGLYKATTTPTTRQTISDAITWLANTDIGKSQIKTVKDIGRGIGAGMESLSEVSPQTAQDVTNALRASGLLIASPVAKAAMPYVQDAAALARAGIQQAASDATKGAARRLLESAAKWKTTLPPSMRKELSRTMFDESIPLSESGYDKLRGELIKSSRDVREAIAPVAEVQVDIEKVLEKTSGAMKKAEGAYDSAAEVAKVKDEIKAFRDNWGGKLTVGDAQTIKQDIYAQLNRHYSSKALGSGPVYTDAEIATKKAIANGLKEAIEANAPKGVDIAALNARESRLLRLEPHLRAAVGRIGNWNLFGLSDAVWTGAAGTIGGLTGGPAGAAILAGAVGTTKKVLGHPGTKSRIAASLDRIVSEPTAPQIRTLSDLEGVLSPSPVHPLRPVSIPAERPPSSPFSPELGAQLYTSQLRPALPPGQGFIVVGTPYPKNIPTRLYDIRNEILQAQNPYAGSVPKLPLEQWDPELAAKMQQFFNRGK